MIAVRYNAPFVRLCLLAFLVLTAGCTTVAPASIEPVEERTGVLYEQVEFEMQLDDIILLNPYLDTESPAVDEFDAARSDLIAAAEILVQYSVDVIEAARITSDSEAVEVFVTLIRDLYSQLRELPFIERHLVGGDVEAALTSAAQQRNLTKALRAAAPVSTMIARAMRGSIDSAINLFDLAFEETHGKIIEENRLFMRYTDSLVIRRNQILAQLLMIDEARQGDANAWEALFDGNEELQAAMGGSPEMSSASIDRAESMILARLATLMET